MNTTKHRLLQEINALVMLPRKKAEKTVVEWVKIAEELTQNRGVLPNTGWLQKNGYSGLDNRIRTHPDAFKHIRQKRLIKTIEEHVLTAEQLLTDSKGVLPRRRWLIDNGYPGLDRCMQNHPERFAHLLQTRHKAVAEHVSDAERLTKTNRGMLPNSHWLVTNGYAALVSCMRAYPNAFKSIEQKRLYKSVEEHVLTAKRLAKENGGVLQNSRWLCGNGYSGLDHCMRNHPRLFSHIKQLRLNTKSEPI